VIPEEGGTYWIDNLVIPQGSQNSKEAHEFINFLLEGRSNAETVMSVFVAPTNRAALALLPRTLLGDKALFPPASILAKCEMIQDLGEALTLWDRIWTEVKAQR
jgi:spermidine/putrescine-binding protein